MIFGVVILHVWALHHVGQNNPTGVEVKSTDKDTVPFTPFATVKDAFAMVCFLLVYAYFRVLHAQLHGPCGQLHPGEPVRDAGAHRSGMVLPAVLRDPAGRSRQARRRAADVRSIAVLALLPGWIPPR